MRVAVLEDGISQLELMSHWVRMAGHSTHPFQHGEMLLRELVHESFDALLLDWNVPDISGIEVLRRVRRESTVPVLFCTGRGDESDVVTALREGADDYLIKHKARAAFGTAGATTGGETAQSDPGAGCNRIGRDQSELSGPNDLAQ